MTWSPTARPCALLLVGLLGLVACRGSAAKKDAKKDSAKKAPAKTTRGDAPPPKPPPDRAFDVGTEKMQAEARRLVKTIPGASEATRIEIAARLSALGEPARPVLIEALRDPEPETRSLSAWLLGRSNDRRTIPALRESTNDPVSYVALEAAASLVRNGDDAGLDRLVTGLEDPDPRLRARSLVVLEERTKQTMDFRADASPEERAGAVARWRAWLARRRGGGA